MSKANGDVNSQITGLQQQLDNQAQQFSENTTAAQGSEELLRKLSLKFDAAKPYVSQ